LTEAFAGGAETAVTFVAVTFAGEATAFAATGPALGAAAGVTGTATGLNGEPAFAAGPELAFPAGCTESTAGFCAVGVLTFTGADGELAFAAAGAELVFPTAGTETTAGFCARAALTLTVGEGFALGAAVFGTTFTFAFETFDVGFSTTVGDCANAAAVMIKNNPRFRFIAPCL
jgi:hypothetical protein